MHRWLSAGTLVALVLAGVVPVARQNRIDVVTPSAPALAAYGPHAVGVRTLTVVDRHRPDILRTREGGPTARYDRALTLEVWYPALSEGLAPGGQYRVITRDPAITATLHGQAVRDAAPANPGAAAPLVLVSHGYPGNRYLLSHLGENLASKGRVRRPQCHWRRLQQGQSYRTGRPAQRTAR